MNVVEKMNTKDIMDTFAAELSNVDESLKTFKSDMQSDAWKGILTMEQIDKVK